MLLRPATDDLRMIAFALGRVVVVVGIAGLLPLGWALARGEWHALSSFMVMVGIALSLGALLDRLAPKRRDLSWSHGMVVVALAWLVVPAIGSVPLMLSGHFGSWLAAYFDAMSGITTTGLSVLQDLDHLPESVNVWRHTTQFLGGQGIVLAALTFFAGSGVLSLYAGEAREERIFPSVGSTARFIWTVSAAHGVVGVTALSLEGWLGLGFSFDRAFFHAINIFMAAFDTGGFSPQSTSISYYHSVVFELTAAVLMVAGAMSFGLHHALWRRSTHRLNDSGSGPLASLEVRTILMTFSATAVVTLASLAALGIYSDTVSLTRRGLFQVLSAHTGTGFMTITSGELANWGGLAFAGMASAMAFGGMASSTAGGVKALRIGLTIKALSDTIREALLPERAVVSTSYHQAGLKRLTPHLAQTVMAISLLYVALYLLGTAVAYAYGYPLELALFESISAAAAVGLTTGVVDPAMPTLLQVVMILQMYVGRLEFVAVFALVGFLIAWAVGK